jgi:sugar phosphate isomerase/epimerase
MKGTSMKLGIGSYAFMWSIGFDGARPRAPMTAAGLLEKADELGVTLVQYGPNCTLDNLDTGELDRLVATARSRQTDIEIATRGLEKRHLERQLELAQRTGAKLVRTIPEIGGAPVTAAQCAAPLQNVLPSFEKAGVRLAIENGKIPARELRELLDTTGSPFLGAVLDTTNSLAVPEGWRYVAELLAPHVMCLHFKDFVIKRVWHMMGFICEGTPSGNGQADLPWLLKTLRISKHDFNVMLELWPPQQSNLEQTVGLEKKWAYESVSYLRRFIRH